MKRPTIWITKSTYSPLPSGGFFARWRWEVRHGDAEGPILASGTTLTQWGAYRQREQARARCKRRSFAHVRPARILTDAEREAGLALINRLMPYVATGWAAADEETLRHEAERLEAEPTSPVVKSMRLIVAGELAARAEAVSAR